MGLLSDPEYSSVRWVKVLRKVHSPLCFLCYVGAILWFFLLANREFNNETYFSENALLPGLVTNEFNGEQAANRFYSELLQELEEKYDDTEEMPIPWLVAKMSQLHLEVHTHNFTLNYPLGQGQVYKGTNVYGILRAPRTSSLEAIVVSAPYRSLSNHQKGTAAGIALMLAFAQFARPQKYWAKDIIFLITEHEQLGMQAWLEAYHGLKRETETFYSSLGSFWLPGTNGMDFGKFTKRFEWLNDHSKCLDPGTLKGRSGSIQAAINLEFHTPKIKYIEVKVEGLNGQLPNLDLVNLVHKLCVKSGIHHSYKNSYSWIRNRNPRDEWENSIWTLLGMALTQIAGVPNGNHGLFHRFGIEAVTLEGRDADDPIAPRVTAISSSNFYRLGLTLESILRSLNNLLERFHQSYFFYMLTATNRFVSIGQYMPTLCLLCGAMLVRALALWVSMEKEQEQDQNKTDKEKSDKETQDQKDLNTSEKETEDVKDLNTSEKKTEDMKDLNTSEIDGDRKGFSGVSVANMGANYLLVHLLGYAVMNLPVVFTQIGAEYFELPSEVSVYYGLIIASVLITMLSPYLFRIFQTNFTYDEMILVNILLLIEVATAYLAIGMHNYPLGLLLAVLYTPLALVVGVVDSNTKSSLLLMIKRIFCLLMHPLSALTLAMILYSWFLFPEEKFLSMAGRGRDAAMQAVMFSIVDSMIYGNWLFNVGACVILPTWIIFWQILCNRVQTV